MSSKQTSWNKRNRRLWLAAKRSQDSRKRSRPQSLRSARRTFAEQRKFARELQGQLFGILAEEETKHLADFGIFSNEKLDTEEMGYRTKVYKNALRGHWKVTEVEQIDNLGHQGWVFEKIH